MTEPAAAAPADVLILGGGIIGLSIALPLLRAGRSVTIVERGEVGRATSHGNCGTITPSHLPLHAPGTLAKGLRWMLQPDAPLRIKPSLDPALLGWLLRFAARCNRRDFLATARVKAALLKASRQRLEALVADERLDCEWDRSGTLYAWRDANAFDRAAGDAALLNELGIHCEVLDGASARRREPALNASVCGAHFHPGDARLRPNRYAAEMARVVRAAGGVLAERTSVTGFAIDGQRVSGVRTGAGLLRGRDVVLALGAWSPALAKALDLRLPIQPGKGYSITYPRPDGAPRTPLVLKERGVCVTAWDSGYRLGSTMEFAGYDASLNRVRLDALVRGAAEYLRTPAGTAIEEEWFGWRPMTPDDLPILGRAPKLSNLVLATGHGMLGVSLSAITGSLVADLLLGRAPVLDLAPFAPTRF